MALELAVEGRPHRRVFPKEEAGVLPPTPRIEKRKERQSRSLSKTLNLDPQPAGA